MIKRTLLFANPVYLSTANNQLVVTYPEHNNKIPRAKRLKELPTDITQKTVPIEDVGVVILEHPQITITNRLLDKLIQNNAAVIHCNQQHLPVGMIVPFGGHTEHTERLQHQIAASLPLKKNLWQQTVKAKIRNQAALLQQRGVAIENMRHWEKSVESGDKKNHEARAAAYYWDNIFHNPNFSRHRYGKPPNNLLNYGYAILRSIAARALVSSGLLPSLGIFHKNKYNAYCLADDIMEPYRPFVDLLVTQIIDSQNDIEELTPQLKTHLAGVVSMDVFIEKKKSPLWIAMSRTTNSLYECFAGFRRTLIYPHLIFNSTI